MTTATKRPLLSSFVIAAISLASPLLTASSRANLVTNGGFESGATLFDAINLPSTGGTAAGGGDAGWTTGDLAGWTTGPTSGSGINGGHNVTATNQNAFYGTISETGTGNGAAAAPGGPLGTFGGGPRSGQLAAVFDNPDPYDGYLTQVLATSIGQVYRLSYWLSNQLGDAPHNSISVVLGGTDSGTAIVGGTAIFGPVALPVPMGWTQYTQDFTATSTSTRLSFVAGNDAAGNLLDDVSVEAVPEVSSFGMITGLGLLAFGTTARLRRRSIATA